MSLPLRVVCPIPTDPEKYDVTSACTKVCKYPWTGPDCQTYNASTFRSHRITQALYLG